MNPLPPSRTLWAILLMIMMSSTTIVSQTLKSARGSAIAAYSPFSTGLSALDWNPAGLTATNDWEFGTTSFYSLYSTNNSYSFHNAGAAKRLFDNQAAALQFSPGSVVEFDVPATVRIADSTKSSVISSYEKTINYSEQVSLGYAYRFPNNLSVGLAAKLIQEKIDDTKYSIDTNSVIHSALVNYEGNAWNINMGMLWNVTPAWNIALGINNLFHIIQQQLPDDEQKYDVGFPRVTYTGIGYSGVRHFRAGIEADTKKNSRLGAEWSASRFLQVRGGMYFTGSDGFKTDAVTFGVGSSYQFIHADLSYITFIDQTDRRGTVDITRFENSGIDNIEFNPYTSDRLSLTLTVQLGKTHESLARIEYVTIEHDIFPASKVLYALNEVGTARVRNISSTPIEAKVGFYVNHVMDEPTQTKLYTIQPNTVAEIPFYAVFTDALQKVNALAIQDGEVSVSTFTSTETDDTYETRILVHGKNDWNGDITMLKFFVTPSDPAVISFTRNVLSSSKSYLDTLAGGMQYFEKAKLLFNTFASRVVYVNDPKLTQDYVQYPSETLSLNGGDCDDMAVSYATLLASVGISTAFVDVVPPEKPDQAHIYMIFDTGIAPEFSNTISDNPKRFVIRKNEDGHESVWIPVETTVIRKGFEEAWRAGADEYFQDVEVNSGLIKGWVHVVNVQAAQ